MVGSATRLFVLTFGAELVTKGLSVRDAGPEPFWSPISGALVETSEGWILFDTGMRHDSNRSGELDRIYGLGLSPEVLAAPDQVSSLVQMDEDGPVSRCTRLRSSNPLKTSLDEIQLDISDISLAIISHLHWDHCGGIGTLVEANVPVALHRAEIAFAQDGRATFAEGFDRTDWAAANGRWVVLDGETHVAPGVTVLPTPGHTPGHVSLRVDLPQTGTWLFPADAADLAQNFIDVVPCGSLAGGDTDAPERADASMRMLQSLAVSEQARIVSGHDPVVVRTATHPPGGHR